MQETVADRNKFDVYHATIPAVIRAIMPHKGFSLIENIAGTVITDNVT